MKPPTSEPASQQYHERVSRFQRELEARDREGSWLAHFRTVAFLAFLGFGFWGGWSAKPSLFLPAVAALVAYVALAIVHAGVLRREEFARVKLLLNERGLKRLEGAWLSFESLGHVPEGHVYGDDLNIAGQGSLFQRLDETSTAAGAQKLLGWLLAPAVNGEEVRARQTAVKELGPLIDFRQDLVAEARLAGQKDKADPSRFLAWAEASSALASIRWAFPLAHVLPVLTIGAAALASADVINALPFYAGLALQIAIVLITRKPIARMWEALSLGERGFVRFEETFRAIDAQTFTAPRLTQLRAGLQDGPPVSEKLKRFARLMGFAELKHSGQMHPIINALTLWDLLVLFRIEAWRAEFGRGVRGWFEALAELEALSSFATWHFERPADVFPEVDDGPVHLEAIELGHPLLENPVRNDVAMKSPGEAWIITGSNMSGKTTLMRATGLNTVMALAGLPVCAAAMKVSRVQVLTSMRVKDSLERGVSYFYAEVQRVKTVLDTAKANPERCLFFLDELFMGTNARERLIASRKLLYTLLDLGASGAVTTHDLALTELVTERPEKVRNVHFRDEVKDGDMTFDYRLREGVVQTTNALEVLRRAGIEM